MKTKPPSRVTRVVLLFGGLFAFANGAAIADDRDILLESAGSPYLFVVLDTSTSITRAAPCSREQALSDMDPFDAMCTTECPLENPECAQICPDLGCGEYDFTNIAPPGDTPTIIRDNGGPGTSDSGWPSSPTDTTAYLGGNYLDDLATPLCGDVVAFTTCESASFDPDPDLTGAGAGHYMIFMWWPDDPLRTFATNTQVEIEHSDSGAPVTTAMTVNQRLEGGGWNAIGTFEIDPAVASGVVTIRNDNGNGVVAADAVGWLKVNIPPCLGPDVYRCKQPICNSGDCYTELNGDDPRSKAFQAKESLYEVVADVPNINYGFATFEQDQMRAHWKHWLYRVADQIGLPTLDGVDFLTGAEEVFGNGGVPTGDGWSCQTSGGLFFDGRVGCAGASPFPAADVTNTWDLRRVRRVPRLGWNGAATTSVWYRTNRNLVAEIFRVDYSPNGASVSLGTTPISVDVDVYKCPVGTCPGTPLASGTVTYDLVSDYMALDEGVAREPMAGGGFFLGQRNSSGAVASSCLGLEGNDDSTCDPTAVPPEVCDPFQPTLPLPDYNLRWPTDTSDPRGSLFYVGDFVPLDWQDKHRRELISRLAPNLLGGASVPDFRSAVYFEDGLNVADDPALANRLLRLRDPDQRPIVPFGNTPLGESLLEFQAWYENDTGTGWADVAGQEVILPGGELSWTDPLWGCREKALLVLTDGQEECWTGDDDCNIGTPLPATLLDPDACGFHDPCPIAATIFDPPAALGFTPAQEGLREVSTYVVGFGVPGGAGSSLTCMVKNGRPDAQVALEEPGEFLFLPENKDELAENLREIFLRLQVEARTFAAAALPAVQSTAADNIYLSSFTPLAAGSFWPGRLDSFRRPLPLDPATGKPDIGRDCVTFSLQAACHSWEASENLCAQAPDATDAGNGIFQLGPALTSERRILYGKASTGARPNALRLFDTFILTDPVPPASNPALSSDAEDLVTALDPAELARYEADSITPDDLEDFFKHVIGETVRIKENGLEPLPAGVVFPDGIGGCDTTSSGTNDSFVMGDVFHATPIPLLNPNNFTYFANNTFDYRDFARDNVWRRRMLVVPTNDGQVHFIDIGIRQVVDNTFTSLVGDTIELFNDGSGHELFAYSPRFALPVLRQQIDESQHIFSLDGTVAVADVYIDPADPLGAVTPADREWRTVVMGGMREGGDVFFDDDRARNLKSGYFALDVTQPDILNARTPPAAATDPTLVPCPASSPSCNETSTSLPSAWTPSCLDFDYTGDGNQGATPPSGCGSPFPSELWTFQDSIQVLESQVPPANDMIAPDELLTFYLDEDRNGLSDLGDTWSRAVIGQIRVCKAGGSGCVPGGDESELEAVQVAIFGGGMDPRRKGVTEVEGSFLYMVDVETGDLIYKRELPCPPGDPGCDVGSAAGDPAVVDKNRDGYFDTVYLGTTEGKVYKVDLTALDATDLIPKRATTFTVDTTQLLVIDSLGGATRFIDAYPPPPPPLVNIAQPLRVTDAAWDPFLIFDSGGSPIYHAPAAFYIPELDKYGLTFGTGDREDLWDGRNGEDVAPATDPDGGQFYVLVDDGEPFNASLYDLTMTPNCKDRLPITGACLKNFTLATDPTTLELATNYLLAPENDTDLLMVEPFPRPGWTIDLTSTARITAEAFLISGILIFSAFDPEIVVTSPGDCQQTGTTRAFVVSIANAAPIAPLGGGLSTDPGYGERAIDRYHEIQELATSPFIVGPSSNPGADTATDTIIDEIDEDLADAIRDAIIRQYPRGSRFNRVFRQVIPALTNSTGVKVYATVPIAIYPADWKDQ